MTQDKPNLEAVLLPIQQACGLPNYTYTSSEHFAFERDQVLAGSWAGLCFASELPQTSYVKAVEFMGLPLLITRNKNNEIKVFHNVCSHRGMILVNGTMQVQGPIRCPYHSWSYSLDGDLKGTPHVGGVGQHECAAFNRQDHGLKPVRCAVWMDIIFINLANNAIEFSQHIKPLMSQWQTFIGKTGLDRLRIPDSGKNLRLQVQSNWKLAVENYCESYHLPWIHPGLNTYSRLEDHYHIMIGENFGGQGSNAYQLSDKNRINLPVFPEWPQEKLKQAEYIAFYPNILLGLHADQAYAILLQPITQDKTIEQVQMYYIGDEALEDRYREQRESIRESWRQIFNEDVNAVEGMQKGRSSPAYDGGAFSPFMDNPTHHFHQWVARKLLASQGTGGNY